jgi:hypothetical protein
VQIVDERFAYSKVKVSNIVYKLENLISCQGYSFLKGGKGHAEGILQGTLQWREGTNGEKWCKIFLMM